jgi:hypothetical protein
MYYGQYVNICFPYFVSSKITTRDQRSATSLIFTNYVPIKHKQMSFVSNGGKFKLYTVLNVYSAQDFI